MKRADFLKRLGIGVAAVVVAPSVIGEVATKKKEDSTNGWYTRDFYGEHRIRFVETISDILPTKMGRPISFFVDDKDVGLLCVGDQIIIPSDFFGGYHLSHPQKLGVFMVTSKSLLTHSFEALPLLASGRIIKTIPAKELLYITGANFMNYG